MNINDIESIEAEIVANLKFLEELNAKKPLASSRELNGMLSDDSSDVAIDNSTDITTDDSTNLSESADIDNESLILDDQETIAESTIVSSNTDSSSEIEQTKSPLSDNTKIDNNLDSTIDVNPTSALDNSSNEQKPMHDSDSLNVLEEASSAISEESLNDIQNNSDEAMFEDTPEVPLTSSEQLAEAETNDKPSKKKSNLIYNLILVACLAVFAICAYKLGDYFIKNRQYKKSMGSLQEIAGDITAGKDPVKKNDNTTVELQFPDEIVYVKSEAENYNTEISSTWAKTYNNLVELNPDCVGWLKVPGTQIDYPVMYTPYDVEKYLYKSFEGKYVYRGCPFLGEGTLLNKSNNYLIYGHRMGDGTAFADLIHFFTPKFGKEYKYAYFNTAFGEGIYELMAVVETKVFDEAFKFYNYTGELTEEEFNEYVSAMKKRSSYPINVTAVYGDQLLSLATCYRDHDPNGRMVVLFKRIQ